MLDGKVIAGLCLKVPLCSEDMSSLFSYTEKIRADGFRAGAASRDVYIEQLELALLQVRKAICGDIHNTDDLLDLIANRDAEVAELKRQIDSIKLATPSLDAIGVLAPHPRTLMENYRKVLQAEHDAEIAEYKQERDQLRAQINVLREALEYCVTQVGELATVPGIASALSSTPEQSITEYRNKVIEAFVNEFSRHVGGDGEFWLHELQDFAMKEQP